ncbi:hypothetical protein Tco_0529245 [Tanacetum coccineum]
MRSLAPTRADLLPPRKRFRDSYSFEASIEKDTEIDPIETKVDMELGIGDGDDVRDHAEIDPRDEETVEQAGRIPSDSLAPRDVHCSTKRDLSIIDTVQRRVLEADPAESLGEKSWDDRRRLRVRGWRTSRDRDDTRGNLGVGGHSGLSKAFRSGLSKPLRSGLDLLHEGLPKPLHGGLVIYVSEVYHCLLTAERITKTKRSKNDQKPTKNERDKNKSEETARDQSRISPIQQERKSKVKIMKLGTNYDKSSKFKRPFEVLKIQGPKLQKRKSAL